MLHADGEIVQHPPRDRSDIQGDARKQAGAADFVGKIDDLRSRHGIVIAQRKALGRGAGPYCIGAGAGAGAESDAAVEVGGHLAGGIKRGQRGGKRHIDVLRRGN